jgi:hypothetical protein
MKKRSIRTIYQLIALIAVVFAVSSCSDQFFNQQNGELITPDQHYKSATDATVSMGGAFVPLQNVIPNLIMIDGLRSDLMDVRPNADLYFKAINDQSFTLDNPYIDPSDYYKVIINVNEVLANIDKISKADKNFDSIIAHSYKGAMIGLRTWSYFNLVRLYGEAAWIDGNLSTLPANMKQTILSKDVMIDTLISQIKPYIYNNAATKEYVELRLSPLMNTKALLGEMYLEKNDYVNAIFYLKAACESYGNDLKILKVDKAYAKEGWKSIFNGSESQFTENISVLPYSSTEKQFNPLPKWMLSSVDYMVKPSQLLIDSFKTQIPALGKSGDLFRGMAVTFDTTSAGESFISKYSVDKGQPYSTDIILSRAADLHLMLAEALNRSGDPKTALILMNAGWAGESKKPAPWSKWSGNIGIRGRASLKAKLVPDSVNHVFLTGIARTEYIEDLIMNERALELAFEGKRWNDLVRVALRRGNPEYLANKVAAKFSDPSQAAAIKSKLMVQANWYLPYKK